LVEVAELRERLAWLRAEVSQQERRQGLAEGQVRILPVTKGHGQEAPLAAVAVGLHELGENYVQECATKQLALDESGEPPVRWHMLGHLQRNKARQGAELFSMVETVDNLAVAQALSRARGDREPLPILCEVDFTGLPGRGAYAPGRLRQELPAIWELSGLQVRGLMTVASRDEPGRCFEACRRLRDQLAQLLGQELPELSMGMSGDFKEAISQGSTEVRVGSLLFGPRA
jgi:hypothetical protein